MNRVTPSARVTGRAGFIRPALSPSIRPHRRISSTLSAAHPLMEAVS